MTKRPKQRARRPVARPRGANGRFLSKWQIRALKGHQTRRRQARARAREIAQTVAAAKHGERARKRTTAKLTDAQREARRRDARRITQRIRRAKKDQRSGQGKARPSFRSPTSPRLKGPSKIATSKPARSTEQKIRIGSGDKFAAQIAVRFKMPAGFVPTRELVREAIAHRLDHGEDAPRVRTRILRWRNPGRRQSEDRSWRQGNQPDAWRTLKNAIRAAL